MGPGRGLGQLTKVTVQRFHTGSSQETDMNEPKSKLTRRHLFAGAATVGAAAAAASLLPGAVQQTTPVPEPKAPPERGGGYHLSEHV
jgi:hypothetical protein